MDNPRLTVSSRLLAAMNAHDAGAMAACVAPAYDSAQPAHPARSFRGRVQVLLNWTDVFAGVPDFTAEVVAYAESDGVEFAEWHWRGHHLDGSTFEMRGTTVFGVADGLAQWGRLYMEPVEVDGQEIDDMVRDTYRAP